MSNFHVKPIAQEVTTTEALQSGAAGRKLLTATELKELRGFVRAHNKTQTKFQENHKERAEANHRAKPQVSAEEQAAAVAARGRTDTRRTSTSNKFGRMYSVLFSSDETFLLKDIESQKNSLKFKSKSLIDHAPQLDMEQKALRNYLVVELALERANNSAGEQTALQNLKDAILDKYGDYIQSSITAFEAGQQSRLSAISLREFVRAYQAIDSHSEEAQPDLLTLFRSVRSKVERDDFVKEMLKVREGLVLILARENKGLSQKISKSRQYLISSKINQINFLIKAQHLHAQFLNCCKKADLKGLPQIGALIESSLQTVATADLAAGITSIIRSAAAVSAENRPGRNIFITNYSRLILQNRLFKDIYRNHAHCQQIVDTLSKNVRGAALLSIGAERHAA